MIINKIFLRSLILLITSIPLAACFGDKAPQVNYKTIKGETITPTDYQGQVMLINFWATNCSTCVKEMPALIDTHNKFKDQGFRTIAVAMAYDRPDYVIHFSETRQLPFDVALDVSGQIAQAFNDVKITPTTFIINRKGNIIKTYVGKPNFEALHGLIKKSLEEPL
jgi:peroxiredoxin